MDQVTKIESAIYDQEAQIDNLLEGQERLEGRIDELHDKFDELVEKLSNIAKWGGDMEVFGVED